MTTTHLAGVPAAPLLVSPDASSDVLGDLLQAHRVAKRHQRRLHTGLYLLLLIDGLTSMTLAGIAYHFDASQFEKGIVAYRLGSSLIDSLALTAARLIAFATRSRAGWWCGFASSILAVCKAIVYSHGSEPQAASALVFAAVAVTMVELRLVSLCAASRDRYRALSKLKAEVEAGAGGADGGAKSEAKLNRLLAPQPSSWRGTAKILGPYFWPHGTFNKLRTLATFFVMAGSKTCNLFAPLYIGAAAQTLSNGHVPYRELGTYCALRFGSSALSELQKLVYIGVKQHAFAEIAETTFRHLLGLSLDWHLKKKMGEVMRVMDRGISSADSVMNYLILFLAPSVAECTVTLVLFFVHFKSPRLSAVAFLSFSLYVVMTVQITQWRKKFRTGQNKQDNKYHELATDSLVNFETVKCSLPRARGARTCTCTCTCAHGRRGAATSAQGATPPNGCCDACSAGTLRTKTSRCRSSRPRCNGSNPTTSASRPASRCSTRHSSSTSS